MLQAGTLKDPSAIDALKDAGNRVKNMMILYNKLYQFTGVDNIPVMNYLSNLVDEVIANFPNSKSVRLMKNIDDFVLDTKILQPLGIIINELLTNIMKYAFTGMDNGLIEVSVKQRENTVSITVADNGIGMPGSVGFENKNSFGLQLVRELVKQINGTIRIVRGKGSSARRAEGRACGTRACGTRACGTKIILEFEKP